MCSPSSGTADGSPAAEPDEHGENAEEEDGVMGEGEKQMREEGGAELDSMQEEGGAVGLLSEPMCFQTVDG